MTTTIDTPWWTQGRARDLLLVWRRQLEWKLQINWYLLGCSRWATLEIMMERMIDKRPGDQQRTLDQPDQDSSHSKSICTCYQQVGSHLEVTPQQLPDTWPKCLGRGVPPKIESWPPSPAPSLTSSNSSRPPSLESLTRAWIVVWGLHIFIPRHRLIW